MLSYTLTQCLTKLWGHEYAFFLGPCNEVGDGVGAGGAHTR